MGLGGGVLCNWHDVQLRFSSALKVKRQEAFGGGNGNRALATLFTQVMGKSPCGDCERMSVADEVPTISNMGAASVE